MEHFANFGIVKKANKQLRRLNDLSKSSESTGLGAYSQLSLDMANKANQSKKIFGEDAKGVLDSNLKKTRENSELNRNLQDPLLRDMPVSGVMYVRGSSRRGIRDDQELPRVKRKPKSYDKNYRYYPREEILAPDSKNFSDIRKTDDRAASPTGYLGYQKDPYKGYGGMMEEPVDVIVTGERTPKARIPY